MSLRGKPVLVFVRTQQRVERLVSQLTRDGFYAAGIHKSKTVAQRRRTIEIFREFCDAVEASPDGKILLGKRIVEQEGSGDQEKGDAVHSDEHESKEEDGEVGEENPEGAYIPPTTRVLNNLFFSIR